MAEASTDQDLKEGFEIHLSQTHWHVERIEEMAGLLGFDLTEHTCKAMQKLIEEGENLIAEGLEPAVRDAAIINTARRVEHFEISAYGIVAALAGRLGHDEVEALARDTLEEEEETEAQLVNLAETAGTNDNYTGDTLNV